MTKTERLQNAAERRDLTQGPITRKIILFSLPIIFGNLFQQLYNVVDSVVVGNFAADGTHCLAAVNASFAIMMVFNALYMGVSMGANIVISQYKGAKDVKKLEEAMTTTFLLSMLAGLFITVVGFICAKPCCGCWARRRTSWTTLPCISASYLRVPAAMWFTTT